ncbi:hypothetical protein ACFVUN_14590 [Kitasatospora griseola]|uniref:hypothetical protein n=1 Tax=Kitasatospora griseola TaxID=2064 RepID=UPI0036DC826A
MHNEEAGPIGRGVLVEAPTPKQIAVRFPLPVPFGCARLSVLGTSLPLALVMLAAVRLHLTFDGMRPWLPQLGPAGLALSALPTARPLGRAARPDWFAPPDRASPASPPV